MSFPISAELRAALASSDQRVSTLVEVLDTSGNVVRELNVVGGRVEIDASAAIRRRCSISLHDPDGDLTPSEASDLLAPYGNELRLWRGLTLSTGIALLVLIDTEPEWDQGTHEQTEAPVGVLQLT